VVKKQFAAISIQVKMDQVCAINLTRKLLEKGGYTKEQWMNFYETNYRLRLGLWSYSYFEKLTNLWHVYSEYPRFKYVPLGSIDWLNRNIGKIKKKLQDPRKHLFWSNEIVPKEGQFFQFGNIKYGYNREVINQNREYGR
jgi:hypothetical protein